MMSRNNQCGTQKWCPSCGSIQGCAALNPSQLGYKSGQRWYTKEHSGIRWFRLGLVCHKCEYEWLTTEVEEEFLDELGELRNALKEIQANAEAYMKESDKASKSLAKLSKS